MRVCQNRHTLFCYLHFANRNHATKIRKNADKQRKCIFSHLVSIYFCNFAAKNERINDMNNLINDIQTLPLWHYRRKSNSLLMTVIFMAFYLTACTDNIDSPVVTPVTTMSLTVNGENYEIDLTQTDTVNLRTLTVEFPTQFKIDNYNQFHNLTIGGKGVHDGVCALQIDAISHAHHIDVCYTVDGKQHTIVLNTLHKNIPEIRASGKATSAGDFYLSYVYQRLIEKVDNNGRLLYYRLEPLTALEASSTGWWDFKKHHADDGKTYYSYHVPDRKYASWGFNGFNPGKRVIMDESYNIIKEVQLEAANGIDKGFPIDGHDFYMYNPDHYIMSSYLKQLSTEGKEVYAAYLQEVSNGSVVFDWWSTDHADMEQWVDPVFMPQNGDDLKDYVHFNSIDILPDGNWLCSFRHVSSIVKIDRTDSTGNILWRVAGADNDGSYAFHGQHCARYQQKDNTITLFNNGNGTGRTQMLRLEVDLNTGQASKSTILLDDGYFTQACGALTFSDDNMIVGWGIPGDETTNNRVVTEYDAAGTEIFSISRLTNTKSINSVLGSYRCVKCK